MRVLHEAFRFHGDSPAKASVSDVLKHSSTAPCTHCTFRHCNGNEEAIYSYSKDIQSGDLTYMRIIHCTLALQNLMLTDSLLRYLGMKARPFRAIDEQEVWPLLKLSRYMKNIESVIPKIFFGMPVVRCDSDTYQRSAVAPDCLLVGLIKSSIQWRYVQHKDTRKWTELESACCANSKCLGCPSHTEVFNIKCKNIKIVQSLMI